MARAGVPVIDPAALAGDDVYHARIEALIAAMCADAEVRLPGERRSRLAQQASVDGVDIPEAVIARLLQLAGGSGGEGIASV